MGIVLLAALGLVVVLAPVAYWLGYLSSEGGRPAREWFETTVLRRRVVQPAGRPIEAIAADLHRLGARFHGLDPHASYTKVEAVRGAYDRSLSECCAALGITHLLGVLRAGPELDAERARVEEQLAGCGVRLPHAA